MLFVDKESLLARIRETGASSVILQLPEGLKSRAFDLASFLEGNGIEALIDAEPCFGACDMRERESLLVHFGHSPISEGQKSVIFCEVEDDFDFIPVLSRHVGSLPGRVGLLTTVQHRRVLPDVTSFLEAKGVSVHVGKGGGRLAFPGQVLGCNFSAARSVQDEVDAFLFLGSGTFHPLGVALACDKPVFRCHDAFEDMAQERDKVLRQRYGQIFRAKGAKTFGIVVSKKRGQRRMAEARLLKRRLLEGGRNALIVEMDFIEESKVESVGLDAYVICACPRIAIDDVLLWKRPVLTPPELDIMLGRREEYIIDEIG